MQLECPSSKKELPALMSRTLIKPLSKPIAIFLLPGLKSIDEILSFSSFIPFTSKSSISKIIILLSSEYAINSFFSEEKNTPLIGPMFFWIIDSEFCSRFHNFTVPSREDIAMILPAGLNFTSVRISFPRKSIGSSLNLKSHNLAV